MTNNFNVYEVYCDVDNRVYIGITGDPKTRLAKHLSVVNLPDSKLSKFGKAIKDLGALHFDMRILVSGVTREEASELERFYILEKGFPDNVWNTTNGGDSGFTFSDEIIEKISEANRGYSTFIGSDGKPVRMLVEEAKQLGLKGLRSGATLSEELKSQIAESNRGQKRSEETKRNIGLSKLGTTHSTDTKSKISDTLKGTSVYVDENGNFIRLTKEEARSRKLHGGRKGQKMSKGHKRTNQVKRKTYHLGHIKCINSATGIVKSMNKTLVDFKNWVPINSSIGQSIQKTLTEKSKK
ncbi:MAG: hypothetical protein DRI71_11485 [Bacteroidetes bacterium]|nr:MAG: hypothetical protein DRI71_11485 [Bacteroidota bacterium]